MALSANTVWEVRTDGSDTNGGGFVTGASGTDYSQQAAAQLSVSDAACTGNTTVTSATGGFTDAMIGNIIYLSSGPSWYQITARTDTNTITIDRNGPNATGMTANVGGALGSPGGLGLVLSTASVGVSGQTAHMKVGTYTLTSTTANISGGRLSHTSANFYRLIGYNATREDDGTPPVIDCAALTAFTAVTFGAAGNASSEIRNIKVDGNDNATVVGFSIGASALAYLCQALDCPTGFSAASTTLVVRCYAESCATNGFSGGQYTACRSKDCGIGFNTPIAAIRCIATGGTTGFTLTFTGRIYHCIAYGQSGDGFEMSSNARSASAVNCIAEGCGGYGFDAESNQNAVGAILDCAGYNNTSGNVNNSTKVGIYLNFQALTGSPFVDAATDDFRLNNTASAGAGLRNAATPVYGISDETSIGAVEFQQAGTTIVLHRPKRVM